MIIVVCGISVTTRDGQFELDLGRYCPMYYMLLFINRLMYALCCRHATNCLMNERPFTLLALYKSPNPSLKSQTFTICD